MLRTDVSVPSGQSMAWHSTAVAVLPLKDLEARLGGSLSTGFLSVTFTGKRLTRVASSLPIHPGVLHGLSTAIIIYTVFLVVA